jgi:adenosylmethionine-8-amino-7-oxononanoate aminotransferase
MYPTDSTTSQLSHLDALDEPGRTRDRDDRYLWHPWSPPASDSPWMTITRGDGYRVLDIEGREYIDASAMNSTCGYAHPYLTQAVSNQMSRLHHVDLSYNSHEMAGLLAERLSSYLPETLPKTLFVNSGSEGLEAALMIAATYWSHIGQARSRVVAFTAGYHGSTLISRSLSGLPFTGHPFRAPLTMAHVDLPAPAREVRRPEYLPPLLAAFEEAFGAPDDLPMAVVVEPLLNVGGGIVLPPGFLRGLRELCDATGTLLIVDEVFTGYGRTGRMFACQREDVTPDILVSSKGLSGGYMPITAVTVQRHIPEAFSTDNAAGGRGGLLSGSGLLYGHTTSGHAVACAAALATLDIVDKHGLVERADHLGAQLLGRLAPLAGTGQVIDVRGLGFVVSVEMSSAQEATRMLLRARETGLLLRQQGPVIMAVPSLITDEEGIAAIADRMVRCATAGSTR